MLEEAKDSKRNIDQMPTSRHKLIRPVQQTRQLQEKEDKEQTIEFVIENDPDQENKRVRIKTNFNNNTTRWFVTLTSREKENNQLFKDFKTTVAALHCHFQYNSCVGNWEWWQICKRWEEEVNQKVASLLSESVLLQPLSLIDYIDTYDFK